jgi:hypothetical protein
MSKDIVKVKLDKVKQEVDLTQVSLSENALSPRGYFTSPFSLEKRKLIRKSFFYNGDGLMTLAVGGGGNATLIALMAGVTAYLNEAFLASSISMGALAVSVGLGTGGYIKMSRRNKKIYSLMAKMENAQLPIVEDWLKTRYNLELDQQTLASLNESIFGSNFSFSNIPLPSKRLSNSFYAVDNNIEFRDKKGDFFLLKSLGVKGQKEFYVEEVTRKEVTAVDKITDSKKIHAFNGEASTLYESIVARVGSLNNTPLDSEQQYYLSSMSAALENVVAIDAQYKKVNMSDESPARVIEILSTLNDKVSRIQTAVLAELEKQLFIQSSSLNEQQLQIEPVKAIDALESQKVEK